MKRRGFIGSIAGLLGLPVAAKAIPEQQERNDNVIIPDERRERNDNVIILDERRDSGFRYYDVSIHDDLGDERGRARGKFKVDPGHRRMVLVEALTYAICTSGKYNISSAKIHMDWIVVPVRISFGLAIDSGVAPSFARGAIVFDAS